MSFSPVLDSLDPAGVRSAAEKKYQILGMALSIERRK